MATPTAAPTAPARTVPDLSFLLDHTSHVLATRMAAAFAEIGSTPRAYCVLMHALSGEFTQIELAAMSDLDKTTMVVTLDELEAAGHAERHPSPTDRRARIVRVTAAGRKAVEVGTAIADRVHREVLEELPPKQREGLVEALQALARGPLAEPVEGGAQQVRRARRARQAAG
ncbi:MAG TPA: MarR family winged helix-turn-helix transcriptional regulator [Actinocrinis sp.]|jgi:DNA-binding MarR family transcriptional regulator